MKRDESGHIIFLSYAHLDNLGTPKDEDTNGWVNHFQTRLNAELLNRGRPDVRLWRDTADILEGDRFSPHIKEGLSSCDLFLPVLSPNYVQRSWCQDEINRFWKRVKEEPELDKRIIPVYKFPLDDSELHEAITGRVGYRFYRENEHTGKIDEFFRQGEEQDKEAYDGLIVSIVEFIRQRLPPIEPLPTFHNPPVDEGSFTTFVAPPAPDMKPAYDKLTNELKGAGIRVRPDPQSELPQELDKVSQEVERTLADAEFAIHLLGDQPGPRIGDRRLVDFLLSESYSAPPPRVIWAPKILFLDPTQPESDVRAPDRDPLEVLNDFGEFHPNDSVIADPFEAFVRDVLRRCQEARPSTMPVPNGAANGAASIYVVGTSDDTALVHEVTSTLIDAHGLRANPCAFQGDDGEMRRFHEAEMRAADVVLYCWGEATEVSVRDYVRESHNPSELGREQPFRATALFPGPPLSDLKRTFRAGDISLHIEPSDEVQPELFLPLVDLLSGGQ